VRFVAPGVDLLEVRELDGVDAASVRGTEVILDSLDADATIRALVASGMAFCDLEVTGADLEAAFVALTGELADLVALEPAVRASGQR
jgi:ABC-2 type transport system ATP-binding protein